MCSLWQLLNPASSEKQSLAAAAWDWERDRWPLPASLASPSLAYNSWSDSDGQLTISFQTFASSLHEMLGLYSDADSMQTEVKSRRS